MLWIRNTLPETVFSISVESCQSEVCEVKRDMIAIKHEIDSVQLVKDEIDDIRESLDRLEAESQRRKNKLLEQARHRIFI
jgi:SP family facilitated glucose transporter-like MFS transporter 1